MPAARGASASPPATPGSRGSRWSPGTNPQGHGRVGQQSLSCEPCRVLPWILTQSERPLPFPYVFLMLSSKRVCQEQNTDRNLSRSVSQAPGCWPLCPLLSSCKDLWSNRPLYQGTHFTHQDSFGPGLSGHPRDDPALTGVSAGGTQSRATPEPPPLHHGNASPQLPFQGVTLLANSLGEVAPLQPSEQP